MTSRRAALSISLQGFERIAGSPGAVPVGDFARIRRELSGRPGGGGDLDGIALLAREEAGLEERLEARILPSILRHARALLASGGDFPLHDTGQPARTVLPRAEVAGWLAHQLLGSISPLPADHPGVDFSPLLEAAWPQEVAKLRAVLEYFDRVADAAPAGHFEIERVVVAPRSAADWASDASPLTSLEVDWQGSIEDAAGHRQVDFANRYLGGGAISGGCVQEEIRFAVAPELFVAMIASPWMRDTEAIVMRGAERFAKTRGYAFGLRFGGSYEDPCERLGDGTPDVELVAIDAINYARRDRASQFEEAAILRELDKARAGFSRDGRRLPIATGNWGCGAFRGDPPLKAVIQWLAASAEGRAVRYCPFGDERVGRLDEFAKQARERAGTVGALFSRLWKVEKREGKALYEALLK